MRLSFLFFLLLFSYCAIQEGSKLAKNTTPLTQDKVYDTNIKTVRLYPFQNRYNDQMQSPIINKNENIPLRLEFDELFQDFKTYNVSLIHCNFDWTISPLSDIEFLYDYNIFPITEYQYSQNTKIPYTHYSFIVPKVKLSGNYVLIVYRDNNKSDIIASQRFMVFENETDIEMEVNYSTVASERDFNQQIDFSVHYKNLELNNYFTDLYVLLRQNRSWLDAKFHLKPTRIDFQSKSLVYEHFNLENNFRGLKEFRFFDARSLTYNGLNVRHIERSNKEAQLVLTKDKSRFSQPYSKLNDFNGGYVVESKELNVISNEVSCEYVKVLFSLEYNTSKKEDIYIMGAFNNWDRTDANKMIADSASDMYYQSLLLKQGFYNYLYLSTTDKDPFCLEGYDFQTENMYEVLVYYKPPGTFYHKLVGYKIIDFNK